MLDALVDLARTPIPRGLGHLPKLEQETSDAFGGWTRIRSDPPESCDPWILRISMPWKTLRISG